MRTRPIGTRQQGPVENTRGEEMEYKIVVAAAALAAAFTILGGVTTYFFVTVQCDLASGVSSAVNRVWGGLMESHG